MFPTSETMINEISNKNRCIHSKNSRNFCFYQIEPPRLVLEICDCKISLFEQLRRILPSRHCKWSKCVLLNYAVLLNGVIKRSFGKICKKKTQHRL